MSLLSATRVRKSYASVALDDVDFELLPGEVHAQVGENGAGKSTLAKIFAGVVAADAGDLTLRGEPYRPADKLDAERHGVRMVMQELNLIGTLTVAESIFLARLPGRFGVINRRRMNADARQVMESVGLKGIEPSRLIDSLGVGQRQLVEIAAGLSRRCDVLILDEPTAALTDAETDLLFAQIRRLKESGVGVIYISHRMEEIKSIADRITVLRDGKLVATRAAAEVGIDEIIRLMVGRELDVSARGVARAAPGDVALRVEGLCRSPVRDVSFEVRRGEVLGFAGLMGSGRTETMRAVFGADRAAAGAVWRDGKPVRIGSPRDAVRHGIALLTEDRKELGLLLPLSVRVNTTLTEVRSVARFGCIRPAADREATERMARMLSLRYSSPEQTVAELSGGNQQKVVVAKWLYCDCDVLLFDEPTRGIDVGAKFEVYALLADLASRGKAIVVVSSDLRELLSLCDRIAVMSAGRLVETFERGEFSQDAIMAAALSGYAKGAISA